MTTKCNDSTTSSQHLPLGEAAAWNNFNSRELREAKLRMALEVLDSDRFTGGGGGGAPGERSGAGEGGGITAGAGGGGVQGRRQQQQRHPRASTGDVNLLYTAGDDALGTGDAPAVPDDVNCSLGQDEDATDDGGGDDNDSSAAYANDMDSLSAIRHSGDLLSDHETNWSCDGSDDGNSSNNENREAPACAPPAIGHDQPSCADTTQDSVMNAARIQMAMGVGGGIGRTATAAVHQQQQSRGSIHNLGGGNRERAGSYGIGSSSSGTNNDFVGANTASGVYPMTGSQSQPMQPQLSHLPREYLDVGSCGSSIITTDSYSLGGASTSAHVNNLAEGRQLSAHGGVGDPFSARREQQLQQQQQPVTATGLAVPPARVTPGSQLDHSLATTVIATEDHRCGASASAASAASIGSIGSIGSVGRNSLASFGAGTQRSERTEGESLAWRRALEDGPIMVQTSTQVANALPTGERGGNGRPPLHAIGHSYADSGTKSMAMGSATTSLYLPNRKSLTSVGDYNNCSPAATSRSTSALMAQNRTLLSRIAHDAQRMEELAVAEAEAREELALLRSQYGKGTPSLVPSLEQLRGDILHRTRQELAAASREVVSMRVKLEESRAIMEALQSGDSINLVDPDLVHRVASAEATAVEIRRQLEASWDSTAREADRASRAEKERDALQQEVAAISEKLRTTHAEVESIGRDKCEMERLYRSSEQDKRKLEEKMHEVVRLQAQTRVDLEIAQREEIKASKDAEHLRNELKALVDHLRILERAGKLGSIDVNQILLSSQDTLNPCLDEVLRDTVASATIGTEKKDVKSALTQTESTTEGNGQKQRESIGINTTVTASIAANLYVDGLQTKSDLHTAELRVSQLQIENSNLRSRCEYMEGQISRCENENKSNASVSAAIESQANDEELRQLSRLNDDLNDKNVRLEQDNNSLLEAKTFVENQNRNVIKRTIELEQLLDDSEAEIVRLTKELRVVEAKLSEQDDAHNEQIQALEEDKIRVQGEWEDARRECELLQQELLDATERLKDYRSHEKELKASVDKSAAEIVDLNVRVLAAEQVAQKQAEENATATKSNVELELQYSNLKEDNAALKKKLDYHQNDADSREDKYNVIVMEKLDLEREIKKYREENSALAQERDSISIDAQDLKEKNASIEAELKSCIAEWKVVKEKFDAIIEEKALLEKKTKDLEAQLDSETKLRAEVKAECDELSKENCESKERLSTLEKCLSEATERLNKVIGNKRHLENQMVETQREWRDVCVQAAMMIPSLTPQTKTSATEAPTQQIITSPVPRVAKTAASVQTDLWETMATSTNDVEKSSSFATNHGPPHDSSSEIIAMKRILSDIQSSIISSQSSTEETLFKSRLATEREVKSLRVSLDTAKEHIECLKAQIPASESTERHCDDARADDFDERILRIKENREKASLAAAYQDKLADLTSPKRRDKIVHESSKTESRPLIDTSSRQQRGQGRRRDELRRNLSALRQQRTFDINRTNSKVVSSSRSSLAERTNTSLQPVHLTMSPSFIKTPAAALIAPTLAKASTKEIVEFTGQSLTPLDVKVSSPIGAAAFSETEAFVLGILESMD